MFKKKNALILLGILTFLSLGGWARSFNAHQISKHTAVCLIYEDSKSLDTKEDNEINGILPSIKLTENNIPAFPGFKKSKKNLLVNSVSGRFVALSFCYKPYCKRLTNSLKNPPHYISFRSLLI